jgi:hypothetical protein
LLTVPEAERPASWQQFLSAENRALLREQAVKSLAEEYKEDFVYDFVEPVPETISNLASTTGLAASANLPPVTGIRKSFRTSAGWTLKSP